MAVTSYATVAATSPLTVYFDGDASHAMKAYTSASYTPAVGDRVRVEVRTPLPSIILGKVS